MKKIIFPIWEIVEASNNISKYDGYCFKVNMVNNLWVEIACENNSVVFPDSKNVIRFKFCTGNGFPIASAYAEYSEEGYYAGLRKLCDWAKEFKTAFEDFDKSTI